MKKVAVLIGIVAILMSLDTLAKPQVFYGRGNDLYAQGKYQAALTEYKKAAEQAESSELYYNMGNAYYKLGDLGHAILYYEKAIRINPGFELARENLEIVNTRIADQIEPSAKQKMSALWKGFKRDAGIETFSVIALLCWLLGGIGAAAFLFGKNTAFKRTGFFAAIILAATGLIALFLSFSTLNDYKTERAAIITTAKVDVRSEPTDKGSNIFVLHEGAKVQITKSEGVWREISIASGHAGWVRSDVMAEI